MSDQNGIANSPFTDAWPTPDVGGTGLSGIGGGLDAGPGGNGIVNSPYTEGACPIPSGSPTPDGLESGKTAGFVSVDGGSPAGSQAPWDITSSRNTVDRK